MTRITTSCPQCGRVELEPDDVTLVVSPHEERSWYQFDCAGCVRRVVKPAPTTVALALASVSITKWTVPAEILERVLPDEAPVIALDDLLDLILDLRAGPSLKNHLEQAGALDPPGWLTQATTSSPDAAGSRPARPNAA